MRVGVIGQGYVGLTASTMLACAGHDVIGVEQESVRLALLRRGEVPFFEPGLQEALHSATFGNRLQFTDNLSEAHSVKQLDAVLVAVGTPPRPSGAANVAQLDAALAEIASLTPSPELVTIKSTIPPGTSERVVHQYPQLRHRYVYNPEFLNQGSALIDWYSPSRVVLGVWSPEVLDKVHTLYSGMSGTWVVMTPSGAEMTKYASNAFLATKISFADEIARLCEALDVHVDEVLNGMGLDPRIGREFLRPGLGVGDSCLPKDTTALARWASSEGETTPVLNAVIAANAAQPLRTLQILHEELGHQISGIKLALLGLRYEPWSDDMRAAPSHTLVPELLTLGLNVRAWEPGMSDRDIRESFPGVAPVLNLSEAVTGAQVVLVLTDWPELVSADWATLVHQLEDPKVVIDSKNCLNPASFVGLSVRYRGIGRKGIGLMDEEALRAAARFDGHAPLVQPPKTDFLDKTG